MGTQLKVYSPLEIHIVIVEGEVELAFLSNKSFLVIPFQPWISRPTLNFTLPACASISDE